ncbi:KGG domain-containing protein [Enterovirga sp.]|uniref:KGG domain-containing protein n=1 Tax=Enterovirga sp. TaxID=2026350 RepID=UPI002CD2D3F3|nr:KGG domain-containing protein [Enterovirga sp.]HMO30077.1 KGG domain-containing protein [Enterovirga sp.]
MISVPSLPSLEHDPFENRYPLFGIMLQQVLIVTHRQEDVIADTADRGFAAMDDAKRRDVACKGGEHSHRGHR